MIRPAAQSPLSAMGDGDVSIAALPSGAHGEGFRRAGFRDVGARFSENTNESARRGYFTLFCSLCINVGNKK